jgi:hypothetical protein
MSLLPRIKQADKTWHGIDGRFSSHYSKRFYKDTSLTRAQKQLKERELFYSKEQFYNEEIEKIHLNKHVLLNLNKEKEKFEKIKQKVLAEKRVLGKKIKQAVIKIQKNIRGYLCRKHHDSEMEELKTAKLGISVKAMNRYVGKCCIYLADNIVEASIVIQKYMRGYLARKLLKRMKIEFEAGTKILNFFKVLRNRTRFKKALGELRIKKKLKEIKHRLRFLRVKEWWTFKRLNFLVIRKKLKSRNTYHQSTHKKSSRSRIQSNESRKSRNSFTALASDQMITPTMVEQALSKIGLDSDYKSKDHLVPPGEPFEKIEEIANEDSLSLTLNQLNFQPLMLNKNQNNSENSQKSLKENIENLSENSESIQESFSTSYVSQNELMSDSKEDDEKNVEENEITEELQEEIIPVKDEKPKKAEEPPEKPIPSYRKPTAAFNSWKKKPPSPEPTPKETFPPPKHLLVWTKCRKIYKNQTKKHKADLSFQLLTRGRRRPKWKPPITANETKDFRLLPKIVKKKFRIPEFLEPYTYIMPSETPESPIKLKNNSESDKEDFDSESSFEYEPADFRSTGLSVALPQLYSIVKSYGKNADIIVKKDKKLEFEEDLGEDAQ